MKKNILLKIRDAIPTMSKGQRKLAYFILDNYEKAAFMTAVKLADAVDTSESTVVRFAVNLGYRGYPDFQSNLREMLRARLTSVQRMEVSSDLLGEADRITTTLNTDISRIRATADQISRQDFRDAADRICSAKHIYVMGMRSSAYLAGFLAYNLRYMFENVIQVRTSSGSEVFEELLRAGEGDVVIAISFPRYSSRIVTAVEFARSNGAYVISLTDSPLSPIAGDTDARLYARSDMSYFADSLVAPFAVIDALIAELASRKKEELEKTLARLEEIWDEYNIYDKDAK
ncbi:MAG: MurR/RpiR family transcriptional regulator [Clostridia bacterium]|nr:MurR/RpiR family transcriptional regulator [Clostridia bacterium]